MKKKKDTKAKNFLKLSKKSKYVIAGIGIALFIIGSAFAINSRLGNQTSTKKISEREQSVVLPHKSEVEASADKYMTAISSGNSAARTDLTLEESREEVEKHLQLIKGVGFDFEKWAFTEVRRQRVAGGYSDTVYNILGTAQKKNGEQNQLYFDVVLDEKTNRWLIARFDVFGQSPERYIFQ